MYKTLFLVFILTGCSGTLNEKIERYEKAGEMAINPDCISVEYWLDGRGNSDKTHLSERRCSGEGCEKEPDVCKGGVVK